MREEIKFSKEASQDISDLLAIYKFYKCDGKIYLNSHNDVIEDLFRAVIHAINGSHFLQGHLPFYEFVHPSLQVLNGDSGWVGHFKELENCRFFLSDIYDFLYLFFRKETKLKAL